MEGTRHRGVPCGAGRGGHRRTAPGHRPQGRLARDARVTDAFPELAVPEDGETPDGAPDILVGPVQRYRDTRGAVTLFLEVSRPCQVEVRTLGPDPASSRCRTWTVHDHHYALVGLRGVAPDRAVPYEVLLDDTVVWPDPNGTDPPSVFAPAPVGDTLRLAFGSCRELGPYDDAGLDAWGADALVALANRLRTTPHDQWPHLILHLGDQVYADEPAPEMVERLRELHADAPEDVREEIQNFEEYTWLYHTTWMHPDVRWLLSTVPSAMILDDHDLRDDWNTSVSWRREMQRRPWWRDRVVGGLGTYWIYQHLGNLSLDDIEADPLVRTVTTGTPEEAGRALDAFAERADAEPDSARWSFARELGPSRLVVVDSRCSRVLDPPERRAMVDDVEWAWLREKALAQPMPRHLLIGSTLPVFMPYGVHHIEGWNEAVATGVWGRMLKTPGERIRQAIDLEHWAAYRRSFGAMVDLLRDLTQRADAPASILIMSGDVHFSYTSRAELTDADHPRTTIHQLVQSPMRNALPKVMIAGFRILQTRAAAHILRPLARLARVKDPEVRWVFDGPLTFENGVMTVMLDGEDAAVAVDRARVRDGREYLVRTDVKRLTARG